MAKQPGNDLVLNEGKTQQIFFGLGINNAYELRIHANTEVKYRGIIID